jgi:hypothetical protein
MRARKNEHISLVGSENIGWKKNACCMYLTCEEP